MKKIYLWLLASIMLVSTLSARAEVAEPCTVAHEAPTMPHKECAQDVAIIVVHDGTINPITLKQRLIALYERISRAIQEFRSSKPQPEVIDLEKKLTAEITSLVRQRKISIQEVVFLKKNQKVLENLTAKGPKVLTQSMQLLSSDHSVQESAPKCAHEGETKSLRANNNNNNNSISISRDIIYHLSNVVTELTRIVLHEHQALMDKLEHHIIHIRAEIELALQKSLLQHFTEQELREIQTFIKSPAFNKLVTHVPMFKEIFFKNLTPEILSKIKTLI